MGRSNTTDTVGDWHASKAATFGTAIVAGHGLSFPRSKPIMELGSALRLTLRADFALTVVDSYRQGLEFKSGRRPRLDLDQHLPGTSQEHYPLCYGAAIKSSDRLSSKRVVCKSSLCWNKPESLPDWLYFPRSYQSADNLVDVGHCVLALAEVKPVQEHQISHFYWLKNLFWIVPKNLPHRVCKPNLLNVGVVERSAACPESYRSSAYHRFKRTDALFQRSHFDVDCISLLREQFKSFAGHLYPGRVVYVTSVKRAKATEGHMQC